MTTTVYVSSYEEFVKACPSASLVLSVPKEEAKYWVVLINPEKHTLSFRDTRYHSIEEE